MTTDEALKMALEALEEAETQNDSIEKWDRHALAKKALRQALAEPKQEPVAWQNKELPDEFFEHEQLDPMWHHHYRPLYAAPPSKPWVSLSAEEIKNLYVDADPIDMYLTDDATRLAKAIEAKLKEKNNG